MNSSFLANCCGDKFQSTMDVKRSNNMKHVANKLLVITMLLSVVAVDAATVSGKSFFLPVANNGTAVDTLGWSGATHKFDAGNLYGSLKIQSEFGQNFKRDEIGKYLLMNGTDTAVFGPKNTAGTTNDTNVYAVNFLLDGAFRSTVKLAPKAQDFVTDFGLFVGLDEWMEGLYFQVHAPLHHARWEVAITETVSTPAAATIGTSFLTPGATVVTPYTDIKNAFKGDKTVGHVTNKWSYGRIDGRRTETKLGDVRVTLGYDLVSRENAHFGVGVQGLFGAGGKSKAEYVFEPVIGYAGRHGVGGVVSGAALLWDKDDANQLKASMHASVVHLFDNEQRRSYDLTNCGKWSRYLLVKKMATVPAVANTPAATYGNVIDNMINIGSLKAKIGIDVAYDANLTFCYHMGNMSLDFGYAVAGHSKEKHKSWVDTITDNTYVLWDSANANANDSAGATLVTIAGDVTNVGQVTAATMTTASACIIDNDRLNKDSGLANSAMSHCVFGGLNYNWMDSDWMPGVGVFGSAHFSGDDNNSFDRWSVGLQGNVSF